MENMCQEPFNKFHLCNFNGVTKDTDLCTDALRRVWRCDWSVEQLTRILDEWQQRKYHLEDPKQASQLLCDAVEMTLIFVQHNFTGPFTHQQEFGAVLSAKPWLSQYDPFERLKVNGEEVNPNVRLGELLVVAREMLDALFGPWPQSMFLHWWRLRLICVHQQIIDELTSDLYTQLKVTANFLNEHVDKLADLEYEALLILELANAELLFHRAQKSDELLKELCQRLQVVLSVEGLLGMRTKFQQKPLPQLCLKVRQTDDDALPAAALTNGGEKLPKLLQLDDDTRLERIRFVSPEDNDVMTLPSILQALVLAKVKQLKRGQPKDRLADEELEPYTQTLLYQEHGPLQVRQAALLLNCAQESTQRRTVERSWKQCEEAVKLLSAPTYTLAARLSYGFAVLLQPKWQVQVQLCELLLSLGMTKSALDIYLEIQAWPEVIDCYTRLELRHKAAEIVQQQLAKKPTVLLHCLLGDATDNPACYATAWEFSKQTSGRAQAHWGSYFFRRAEYMEAVPHLRKSVEINALQEKIWLRLGFAAIELELWELAVTAYITYTHLEPQGFQSWNNLAKALVKLGDKKRAHKVLAESLKCNYTNWKVWENFMVVSVDTGNFEDALNAYNRLSELKDRYLDLEVLCVTINAIVLGKPDAKGQSPERLRNKAVLLLGHQCVKHGNEPRIWELAALLAPTPLSRAEKLVKALRAHTSKEASWATKQPITLKALQLARELCSGSLEALIIHAAHESAAMLTSQLSSSRLAAQACVRAAENDANADLAEIQDEITAVKALLEKITEQLKERMAGRN